MKSFFTIYRLTIVVSLVTIETQGFNTASIGACSTFEKWSRYLHVILAIAATLNPN